MDDIREDTELVDISSVSSNFEDELTKEPLPSNDEIAFPSGRMEIANLRERFAAFFIDSTIFFYLYWALGMAARRAFYSSWDGPLPCYGWQGAAFHFSFLILVFIYYFIFESVFFTTIGKIFCRMQVRRRDFGYISMAAGFFRNLLRFVDYALPILPIVCMELTKTRQRFGDILANTTVIKKLGNTSLRYNITVSNTASASGRIFSFLIDLCIVGGLFFGYSLLLSTKSPHLSKWLILLSPLVPLIYFISCEVAASTTPGKWLFGYVVAHEDGLAVSFSGSLVRTVLRLFDTNPIGVAIMWMSPKKQRPGDIAADTIVTRQQRHWKGTVCLGAWLAIASLVLWSGYNNRNNYLNDGFKLNFLPTLELMGSYGVDSTYTKPTITHVRFASGTVDTVRTPPVFSPGEQIFLVFDLYGYEHSGRMVWIQEDLDVKYPDGSVALHHENIIDYHQVLSSVGGPIEFANNIELPKTATPGAYAVTIILRDLFSHERITTQLGFEVRAATQ